MPARKVRDKETGDVLTVQAPEGASHEEIIGLARRQASTRALARREPTTRSADDLDTVGRAKRWLTAEPPAGSKTTPVDRAVWGALAPPFLRSQPDLPGRVVRAAGDLELPGSVPDLYRTAATLPIAGGMVTGPLKRTVAGALAGGGAKLVQTGGDLWAAGKEAVGSGLSQFAGELLPGALRFGATQRAAKPILAKTRHDTAMHEAVSGAEQAGHAATVATAKEAHAAQVRDYEQQGAATIMDAIKAKVSALTGMPSNERGLLDTVYGKGQKLVSAKYDEVVKDMIAAGRGRTAEIRLSDANALGLRRWNTRGQKDQRGVDVTTVDASQLAERIVGVWKRDPGLYRRGVNALDALDIGDPAARAEYKAFQALVQFADKSGMLRGPKGQHQFNPEKAMAGFTKLKTVDELRRRGAGDIFEGPIAEASRRNKPAPFQAPEPPPPRQAPPTAKDRGVETAKVPEIGFFGGAMLAEVPFLLGGLAMGHQGYHGYGLPAVGGGLTARGLGGRTFATKAPLTPAASRALELLPPALAQETSSLTRGARPQPLTLTPSEVSPETQREAQEYYDRQRRGEDPSAP